MPAAADLQFLIGANSMAFSREMAKVQRTARTAGADVAGVFGAAQRSAGSMLATLRSLPAALAALGIGFSLGGVARAIKEVADIGDVADRVGVTTDALQALRLEAEQTGASAQALDAALQSFGKNTSEAATGATSDFAKILKANNVELADGTGKLRSQMEMLQEYAELVRRAASQQDRIRLLTAAFGDAGVALEGMFRNGAAGMREFLREQAASGGLVPPEQVRAAQELDLEYSRALGRMDAAWKSFVTTSVAEAMKLGDGIAGAWERIAGEGGNEFLEFIEKLQENWGLVGYAVEKATESYRSHEGQIRRLTREIAKLEDMRNLRIEVEGDTTEIEAKLAQLRRQLASLQSGIVAVADAVPVAGAPVVAAGGGEVNAGGTQLPDDDAAREAERRAAASRRVLDALTLEWQQLGMNSEEQRIANELARAGVTAKSEQGQAIAELVRQIEGERAGQAALSAVMEDQRARLMAQRQAYEYLGQTAEDALLSIVDGSADAEDALKRLAVQLAVSAAKAALLGQGPLAGLFGPATLPGGSISPIAAAMAAAGFGGLFADGGKLPAGKWGIAGEKGVPEIISGPATITPVQQIAAVAAGPGGKSVIELHMSGEVEARILQQAEGQSLRIVRKQAPGVIASEMGNPNSTVSKSLKGNFTARQAR